MGTFLLFMFMACEENQPVLSETVSPPLSSVPAAASEFATVSDTARAGLEAGDRADGVADHVVEMCAGCSLVMEGSPAHIIEHADYQLHMCSADCKTHFETALDANLSALAN